MKHARLFPLLVLLMLVPRMHGQDASSLAERLHAADVGSALDAPDVKPWHLKMTVQLFDTKGKATDQGTVEEWWSGIDTDRREFRTRAYAASEITSNGKRYRSKGAGSPPFYLDLLLRQVVHPLPRANEGAASTPTLKKQMVGKVALDCIVLVQPVRQPAAPPLGFFPTYCLDEGKTRLRMSVEYGDQVIARNAIGQFEGKSVPIDIVISANNATAATAHIDALTAGVIPESEFTLSGDFAQARTRRVQVDSVVLGTPTNTVPPRYPAGAKTRKVTGVVLMGVTIGTDGHVLDVKLISSADSELADAAMAAVHQWTYKPYIVHAEPVEVETTVTVEFTAGH